MAVFDGKFQRVAFIVSSGRTGTTALAHHLDVTYDDVRALHEPRPSWRLRRASAKALAGRMAEGELVSLLADSRRRIVAETKQPIYIESNPFLGGFLESFDKVFPRPLVVHVVRDPRSFIRSSMNFGAFRGLKNLATSFIPWWLPKPERFVIPQGKSWPQMSPPERLAWYWSMLNTELNRGEMLYGERYLRIRFEDVFAKNGSGLRRLTDFLGLPWNPALLESANSENVNASSDSRFPAWQDWDEALKQAVVSHCGPLMELYGYA